MNTTRSTNTPPKDWTPEVDNDPQWQSIVALLRAPAEPELPGEARWEEMRSNIWREAGIGESASPAQSPVVPIAEESLARPRLTARLLQIAAVGVAAFALGWVLGPSGSSPENAPQVVFVPSDAGDSADPDKDVIVPGGLPERILPVLPSDGVAVPVSGEGAPVATPRHVVIRDGGPLSPPAGSATPGDLLPQFIRTLRAQPDQTVSPDAILESVDTLLRDNPSPPVEASLRYLKAEVLFLEKRDNDAAVSEYEEILRLTNNEGPLAENARSRLASLR